MRAKPVTDWYYPSLFEIPLDKIHGYGWCVSRLREIEESIIAKRLPKLKKIIRYKGRTLDSNSFSDFESQSLNRLFRSVRLHIDAWQSGKMDKLLTVIADRALQTLLKKKMNREKRIKEMKQNLLH